MANSRKKQRGTTLIELLTATSISVFVIFACLGILFTGSASWARGLGHIGADTDAQMAVRIISKQLQEAMAVTVSANGQSLTYELPQTDGNGNYLLPLTWDGVARSVEIQNNNQLVLVEGNEQRVIANGVILTDPLSSNGSTPYRPFTAGIGSPTTQVTIEVATRWNGYTTEMVSSRERETIYLRNIQQTTNQ